jgi:thiamine biosynthesis lipoprotein
VSRHVFRAMGCEVVVAGASAVELDAIGRLFRTREATFTRFRPGGELLAVNAAPLPAVAVSRTFAQAVAAALAAAEATDGLVDPTVGAALEAAGYTADIGDLVPDPRPLDPVASPCWRSLRLTGTLLVRPPGTVLDLNGVVKSMAVDAAVALLRGPGFVSAGGDIATGGATVPVALPDGEVIALEAGGIATSGVATRRWLRGGRLQHHLIDPRSGRPAGSPWTHVTAVGRDCLAADVAAKAGFLRGADGPGWLNARGVAARFIAGDEVVENGRWAASTAREASWA